ncbi:mechanosensitive ion channel family protein [Algoriphagus namhaensis]|uniref:Mechanosensitive ion channel family protein n=1 Tax=Algoriphagus namhaensis TaxID=915353 RepID=A0ABV8ATQ8_9BACT
MTFKLKAIYFLIVLGFLFHSKVEARQDSTGIEIQDSVSISIPKGYPVLLDSDTLLLISQPSGPVSAKERAQSLTDRLIAIMDSEEVIDSLDFTITAHKDGYHLQYRDQILMAITSEDIEFSGLNGKILSENYLKSFRKQVPEHAEERSLLNQITRGGIFLGILLVLLLIVRFLNTQLNKLVDKLKVVVEKRIPEIKIKNYHVLTRANSIRVTGFFLKVIKVIFLLIFVNIALPLSLRIFPSTEGIGETLVGYIMDPLLYIGKGFINYIPELFTIVVIVVITRFIVKGLEFFTNEITRERLKLPGFYPEWAIPTFNLIKIILYAFAFIVIFPYLPGSDSPAFQGVSVFLGVLISLGSTSAISNIVAGLVIIYMRAFKKGDRVKIGNTVGDVIEKTMLVTRIRTIKNEEVTIPNATILAGNTINYSVEDNGPGLILNTAITIGYDVPWRKVHELLISAAQKTNLILAEPKPFVLQTSLDDFYVSYQINAYTKNPKKSAVIYSDLHSNIQDAFAEAGVEIMSPHYQENREGSLTIPPVHVPNPEGKKGNEKPKE